MLAEVQVSVMSFKASEEQLQQQQQQFVMHIIQITRFVIQFCSDGGGTQSQQAWNKRRVAARWAVYRWKLPHLVKRSQVQQSCEALGALKQAAGDTRAAECCNWSGAFSNTKRGFSFGLLRLPFTASSSETVITSVSMVIHASQLGVDPPPTGIPSDGVCLISADGKNAHSDTRAIEGHVHGFL